MTDHPNSSTLVDATGNGKFTRRDLLLLGGTLGFCLGLYLVLMDRVAGLFADDAWYALLAKSIATGQGYQVLNSPTPGILPLYPPLYPLLLSLPFRVFPDFPQNVFALKSISVIAMMALGVAGFVYFSRYRELSTRLSLIVVALTLLCQPLMFLATSTLMSECVFAFEVMAMFLVGERLVKRRNRESRAPFDWGSVLLLSALASAIFLTRTIGMVLVVALLVDLIRTRLIRECAVVLLISGLAIGLWTLQTRHRTPTPQQRLEQGGNIIMNYREQFWQQVAGINSGTPVGWTDLPGRFAQNVKIIVDTGLLQISAPLLLRELNELGETSSGPAGIAQILISLALAALILIGYLSAIRVRPTAAEFGLPLILGLIVLWPFRPLRFLAPLAPFIFYYLLTGVETVWQLVSKRDSAVERNGAPVLATAWVLLVISVAGHFATIYGNPGSASLALTWEAAFDDNEKLMAWVTANIPKSEVLISNNPALLSLFTGHKSVNLDLRPERWEMFRDKNLRYVVLHRYEGNDLTLPGNNFVLHRIRNQADFRVIDLGPPATRPAYVP